MARGYTVTSDVIRTTTTSATYQNKIGTFLNSSQNNVLFMTALLDGSATNSDARVRLRDNSDGVDQLVFNIEAQDTTDVVSIIGFTLREGSGFFGLDKAYDMEYSSESGGTTGLSDAYLVRLELVGTDKFTQNLTLGSTTSATFANLCSVTCAAGNWLILASGEINTTDTTPATTLNFELHDGTTQLAFTGPPYVQDTTNFTPLWLTSYVNPTQTTNYTLRWKSDGTATIQARNIRLLALDLSQFKNWKIVFNNGSDVATGIGSRTVQQLNTSYTGDDDYLVLFGSTAQGSSTSASMFIDYTIDNGNGSGDTNVFTRSIIREMNDLSEYYDMGAAVVSNLKNKRNIFKQKANAETGATSTAVNNRLIAMLQLGNTRLNRRTITVR